MNITPEEIPHECAISLYLIGGQIIHGYYQGLDDKTRLIVESREYLDVSNRKVEIFKTCRICSDAVVAFSAQRLE